MSELTDSNALAAAQNGYFKWLTTRFRTIHLMEMGDDVDPVPLRKIFIPMRVDLKDLAEDRLKTLPAFLPSSQRGEGKEEPEIGVMLPPLNRMMGGVHIGCDDDQAHHSVDL